MRQLLPTHMRQRGAIRLEHDDIGVTEAAKLCGLPARTVRHMCAKGEWSTYAYQVTHGKRKEWRISNTIVRRWIHEHPVVTISAERLPKMVAKSPAPTPDMIADAVETRVRQVVREEVAAALETQQEEMGVWLEKRFGPAGKRAGLVSRVRSMLGRR